MFYKHTSLAHVSSSRDDVDDRKEAFPPLSGGSSGRLGRGTGRERVVSAAARRAEDPRLADVRIGSVASRGSTATALRGPWSLGAPGEV